MEPVVDIAFDCLPLRSGLSKSMRRSMPRPYIAHRESDRRVGEVRPRSDLLSLRCPVHLPSRQQRGGQHAPL